MSEGSERFSAGRGTRPGPPATCAALTHSARAVKPGRDLLDWCVTSIVTGEFGSSAVLASRSTRSSRRPGPSPAAGYRRAAAAPGRSSALGDQGRLRSPEESVVVDAFGEASMHHQAAGPGAVRDPLRRTARASGHRGPARSMCGQQLRRAPLVAPDAWVPPRSDLPCAGAARERRRRPRVSPRVVGRCRCLAGAVIHHWRDCSMVFLPRRRCPEHHPSARSATRPRVIPLSRLTCRRTHQR